MFSVDASLAFCRTYAAFAGDPSLPTGEQQFAAACERLLVEVELARAEATRYREILVQWNIPYKRAMARRLEGHGFEIGWEDEPPGKR